MSISKGKALPVITAPLRMRNKIEKEKLTKNNKQNKVYRGGDTSQPIIVCKRPELNFYRSQTYEKFKKIPLASEGWLSKKSKKDHFIVNAYTENPAFMNVGTGITSFSNLNFDKSIVEALNSTGYETPTNIQALSIPHILNRENTLIAAETGNGKTLAYGAPLIQQVVERKNKTSTEEEFNSPSAVVIVPSRELVIQTRDMLRHIGSSLDIQVNSTLGGHLDDTIRMQKKAPMDILVGSFGALMKTFYKGLYKQHRVRHIVLDEADTLLDDSFSEGTIKFLSRFMLNDQNVVGDIMNGVQLSCVGATFPVNIRDCLEPLLPADSLVEIRSPFLHRLSSHVSHLFRRIAHDSRADELLKIAKKNEKLNIPTIIFSKDNSTAQWMYKLFQSCDIKTALLASSQSRGHRTSGIRKFMTGEVDLLCTTDLGSRGLNTLRARQIINYDFPHYLSDYLHRAGRTGRVGGAKAGLVINFVSRPPDITLTQKIEYAVRRSEHLPNVDANILSQLKQHREQTDERDREKETKVQYKEEMSNLKTSLNIN